MKSIMEQASSIIKAIEKAWDRAGNPKEFSIKIFEKEEKNFFGMTTKPAKIGIFFDEKPEQARPAVKSLPKTQIESRPERKKERPEIKTPAHKEQRHEQKQQAIKPQQEKNSASAPVENQQAEPRQQRVGASWNNEMIHSAQTWIKNTLSLMGLQNSEFSTQVTGKHLKIIFVNPILGTVEQDRQLFRSFAYLIVASLRNQFKQEIKDLKVVLMHQ